MLLRPSASRYVVLGEAYIDDMMDGEAFRGLEVQIKTMTLLTLTISASVSASTSTSISISQISTVRSPLPTPSAPHQSCPSVPSPSLWLASRLSA